MNGILIHHMYSQDILLHCIIKREMLLTSNLIISFTDTRKIYSLQFIWDDVNLREILRTKKEIRKRSTRLSTRIYKKRKYICWLEVGIWKRSTRLSTHPPPTWVNKHGQFTATRDRFNLLFKNSGFFLSAVIASNINYLDSLSLPPLTTGKE